MRQKPQLPEEHFLDVVYSAAGVDVLLITGLRNEAPVATLSHLVPDSRVLDVHVQASTNVRHIRVRFHDESNCNDEINNRISDMAGLDYCHILTFANDINDNEAAKDFAENSPLPFFHENLKRLENMVRLVPDFPRHGLDFRHVLGISQQPGGLALCTSLLQTYFTGDWAKISAVVCCEVGGLVYASLLALQVYVPLVLIRDAGKLPPLIVSIVKPSSHISSLTSHNLEKRIEMERDVIPSGASVMVSDDVLATGERLCAVFQLLHEAGVGAKNIRVMVVAEFPVHSGRELLRRRGSGGINIQSLLIFSGA